MPDKYPQPLKPVKPVYVQSGDHHLVVTEVKVLVLNNDGSWYAQGLDIDYAAEGSSLDDVRDKFAEGFKRTIHEHLCMYGNIDNLVEPAPVEYWKTYFGQKPRNVMLWGSVHTVTTPPDVEDTPKRKTTSPKVQFDLKASVISSEEEACVS